MVTIQIVRAFALSFPQTDEHPHFERMAFRVKKKIFTTLMEKNRTLNVKLSLVDQSVFCQAAPGIIYPVNGKWGAGGMTTIELKKARRSLVTDALTAGYCHIAPRELAAQYLHRGQ